MELQFTDSQIEQIFLKSGYDKYNIYYSYLSSIADKLIHDIDKFDSQFVHTISVFSLDVIPTSTVYNSDSYWNFLEKNKKELNELVTNKITSLF